MDIAKLKKITIIPNSVIFTGYFSREIIKITQMFFILSKLLTFLLLPYVQMAIWFVLAVFLKNKVWKNRFLWAGIFYLAFFSNRFIVNEALLAWEVRPTPLSHLTSEYEIGIILGGTTDSEKEPRDRIYILKSAERMTHTVQLYKTGIIKKIMVSGGSSNIIDTRHKEADNMRTFLILCGISEEDIIVEDQARNTYENARYCSEIIRKNYPDARVLMITSAFHMRRSLSCFRKSGLTVEGFSTDFYSGERKFTPDTLLIPDPSAFAGWHMIIREWMGIIFYKLAGYI